MARRARPDDSDETTSGTPSIASDLPRPHWWFVAAFAGVVVAIVWAVLAMPDVDGPAGPAPSLAPDGPARSAVSDDPPKRAELSDTCAEAAVPLRDLAASEPSALGLDEQGSEALTDALASAARGCSAEEYSDLVDVELSAWLLAPVSSGD